MLGLKSGIWNHGFAPTFLAIFAFIVMFSVVTVVSVTTNTPAALLVSFTMLIFSPILAAPGRDHTGLFFGTLPSGIPFDVLNVPKPAETIGAMRRLILERPLDISWVVGTSVAFALVCYIVTMVYFTRKDY